MKEGKKREKIKKKKNRVCVGVGVRINGNVERTVGVWVRVTELILGKICNLIMKAP